MTNLSLLFMHSAVRDPLNASIPNPRSRTRHISAVRDAYGIANDYSLAQHLKQDCTENMYLDSYNKVSILPQERIFSAEMERRRWEGVCDVKLCRTENLSLAAIPPFYRFNATLQTPKPRR